MRNLRLGRRGVAGFFEEIPAATVAIISLLLFFSAMLVALTNYNSDQQESQFTQQAQTFLEGLLSYANLTCFGGNCNPAGTFDFHDVQDLTIENLTYNFHPPFQYSVSIVDTSLYTHHVDTTVATSTFPANPSALHLGWVRDSTSVDIWVYSNTYSEIHAATLTVVIWS